MADRKPDGMVECVARAMLADIANNYGDEVKPETIPRWRTHSWHYKAQARTAILETLRQIREPGEPVVSVMLAEMNACIYADKGYVGMPADAPERALKVFCDHLIAEIGDD